MLNQNEVRLVLKSEINTAIKLWDCLTAEEITHDDPFGGQLGRSGASAYNFLLLATSRRTWLESFLEDAVKCMKNHKKPGKTLSRNVGHIRELIENPNRCVNGAQSLIRVKERQIQVNPLVLPKITFPYIDAAISN